MDFEKITEAMNKAPAEIKKLMFSAEVAKNVQNIATENNLDEEQSLKLADEISYVILGLKNRVEFEGSLARIDTEREAAKKVAKEVELKVFSQLDKVNKAGVNTEQPEESKTPSNITDSFTQAIINQAKAMRPISAPPDNLPIENKLSIENKPEERSYQTGTDPYREPLK